MTSARRAALFAAALLLAGGVAAAAAAPRVLSPEDEETVHTNGGRVPVVVVDVPAGARVRPLLDGQVASAPVAEAAFELRDVPRGTHVLELEFVDAAGHTVGRSEPVVFHVWQASRLFRQP